MPKEFKLPDPGEGIHEAEILEVYVSEGDEVQEDDIILHIETDKAAVEVPSPFSGVVEEIFVKQGDIVEVGEVLMTFREETVQKAVPKKSLSEEEESPEVNDAEREKGEKETDEEEKLVRAKEKEKKESDKRTVEQEGKEGPLAEDLTAEKQEIQEQSKRKKKEDQEKHVTEGPVPASPATRRLARELRVDLQAVSGSGPGGRVTAEDVRTAASESEKKKAAKTKKPEEQEKSIEATPKTVERRPKHPRSETLPPLPDFSRWGPIEHIPLRSIRRATARRMALAWSQIPHVTHQDVADITELEAFRRRHQDDTEEYRGKLSLTVFVMQAVVAALKQFPRFNASLDFHAEELIFKHYFHIGVAVDTDQGLVVPVIRDVDRKSLTELAAELSELVERVRQKKAKPEDMRGGTFTITNPGPIGGRAFTPIINYPEVAILGVARARIEPVVEGDLNNFTIVPRLHLPLHLAFDHRVNDGADAARFLRTVIDILSDPESFILNV